MTTNDSRKSNDSEKAVTKTAMQSEEREAERKTEKKSQTANLNHTMRQLQDSLSRWQELSEGNVSQAASSPVSSTEASKDVNSAWVEETRSLLQELGRQLDSLSN